MQKLVLAVIVVLGLVGVGFFLSAHNDESPVSTIDQKTYEENNVENAPEKAKNVVFTHHIFDPQVAGFITPLGELNGGYEEVQTIAGVMVNLKSDQEIEVRAPTDMVLESYAYYTVHGETDWTLIFRISPEVALKFDHINRASQAIVDATTTVPKDNSAEQNPKQKITVKAGEIIGNTRGTSLAHNWNIYLTDSTQRNDFINDARFESSHLGMKMVRAKCPFDFYTEDMRAAVMPLMGYSKPGQSATCGSVSHDVAGSLSGMWHFSSSASTGLREEMDGVYASPLSVIKNSAGQVTIDQVNDKRLDVYPENPTNKDPAEITTQHCYKTDSGYAFFKIVSVNEMKLAFGSGSCPFEFPANAKTYYR